ncbi:MAG: ABC transporter permease [Deferribacteres bacterium]|nr:ABC transporter permease [candidate division KSB1 bacterium]MCB9509695.1 ABC transporter permease [Deferribacteres bacterium]
MFKNYLIIALRTFRKRKSFSLINLAGLAVGVACFWLISLYVQFELSFDRYHEKSDRIYRVVAHQPGNIYLGTDHFAVTQAVLAKTLKQEYPEVLAAVTIDDANNVLISVDEKDFYEDGLLMADDELFELFDFPFLVGDPKTALAEPFSIVLTEEVAHKYFGNKNPMGRIIRYNDQHDFKVTGVLQNIPRNSHFHFRMLMPFQARIAMASNKEQYERWGNSSFYTYILVPQNFDQADFEAKLVDLVKKYHTESWRQKNNPNRYYLQRLTDIHLYSKINFDIGENNDIRYIYLLSGLAIIMLAIACINYINLTTARASLRAREVGMRKVVGASRWQLIKQFIGESLLLVLASTALAFVLVTVLLSTFSSLVGREFSIDLLLRGEVLFSVLAAMLLVAMVSGGYPALVLSNYQPAVALKGEIRDRGRSRLRSGLVVLQFIASISLIICTIVVLKQLNFIKSTNLGYNREQVLVLRLRDRAVREKIDLLKNDLLANPNVLSVTASGHLPTRIGSQTGLGWTRGEGSQDGLSAYNTEVDENFLNVFEIELVEGRNFSAELATDTTDSFIINEKLRDALGWQTGVNQPFGRGDQPDGRVIGVIKNFHMHSFREEIQPLFLQFGHGWISYVSARIRADDIPATIEHFSKVWQKYSAHYPVEHFFLDEQFNRMYDRDEKLGEIFSYFTFLTIFIACLGLYGLAAFVAERKTKEIGVRKVLGASVGQLLVLLSRDFTKLVIVANLLAWPLAWLGMERWLQGFAYRTAFGWTVFVSTAIVALIIALATVSLQTIRAARANPVDALKYE